MTTYKIKCKVNGEIVDGLIDENDANALFEKIETSKAISYISDEIVKLYPFAKDVYEEKFVTIVTDIAYEMLDYAETLGVDWRKLSDVDIANLINDKLTVYSEIRYDFFDETEKCHTIDAWKTEDDNEEGIVVAKVYEDGKIVFLNEEAEKDINVLAAIKELSKERAVDSDTLNDNVDDGDAKIEKIVSNAKEKLREEIKGAEYVDSDYINIVEVATIKNALEAIEILEEELKKKK